jgi:hypothetical protein
MGYNDLWLGRGERKGDGMMGEKDKGKDEGRDLRGW